MFRCISDTLPIFLFGENEQMALGIAALLWLAKMAMSLQMSMTPNRRQRILPVYAPDYWDRLVPIPIPGDETRKLRYSFERPADLEFVKEVKRYGAFVQVVSEKDEMDVWGEEKDRVGVIVDVALADVAQGKGAVVGRCRERCVLKRVVRQFPFQTCHFEILEDHEDEYEDLAAAPPPMAYFQENLTAEEALMKRLEADAAEEESRDALGVMEVLEDSIDDPLYKDIEEARSTCYKVMDTTLAYAAKVDPNFGTIDATTGVALSESEYDRMRTRLRDAYQADQRNFGFVVMSMAGLPSHSVRMALTSKNAARRYAYLAHVIRPIADELADLAARNALTNATSQLPPRPAPINAAPTLALLRPGRRLRYWWSDEAKWKPATIVSMSAHKLKDSNFNLNAGIDYYLQFDHQPKGRFITFPLAGADRFRFYPLALDLSASDE